MGYFANIKNVIRKTFSVKGRASLGEIWSYESVRIILFLIPWVLLPILNLDPDTFSTLWGLCWLIPLIPMFALWIRRLHDNSMSAWWMIMWFIPLFNLYIFFYLYLADGDEKENKYGPSPNQQKLETTSNDV